VWSSSTIAREGVRPVQAGRVGGEDAQVPAEHVRFVRVLAVAKLQMADDDVVVLERASEHRGGLVEDPCLLAARGGRVNGGVRNGEKMLEGEGGKQRRLSLPPRE
jgi:hypothetical protein